ncbi:cytidylyltransferase domain-containing protein [Selenomonas artemidis]|uniref:cytidylyltransferase domain-containing protein n=1 Tax=Selenomonas artemidis TaxID=671224 RepID=UPI00288A63F1|nr:glycosyltransferase [Selenomonas artemidis]
MRILAVIPARGGSKGIPKKNIRLMNGCPLISYAIRNARASQYITDVFVSTDSREIAYVARQYGAGIIYRGEELSSDMVTLDPVIYHAMQQAEKVNACKFDAVITMQPTSPLLQVKTLDHAIDYFLSGNFDTVISAVNRPHLSWGQEAGIFVPLYKERKNRQELPAQYFETGAFVIARRSAVKAHTRIGTRISVYETGEQEGIDIDSREDWLLAERLMKRKKIIFRADGYAALGMGHIYNCITMAYAFIEHDILIITKESATEGLKKIKESNLPYAVIKDDIDIKAIIDDFEPDIWVNDCLDTEASYIRMLKKYVPRVVTIEDLGSGCVEADAAINALYSDDEECGKNVYSGYRYVCLRDEFQLERPKEFSEQVFRVLIMFGGTDPANLNRKLYDVIEQFSEKYENIAFQFITGIGYDADRQGVVTQKEKNIYVYPNVPRVTEYMKSADLAITSQGRTIFELAAMGVPAIVLSQNEREATHSFAQMEHGFLNLGMGEEVDKKAIENTLDWLINTVEVRRNMYNLMVSCGLRQGVERVKKIILGEENE